MIDALLAATKEAILDAGFGWDRATCDIMGDGRPPAKTGGWFCAIHQGRESSDMMNALDERFGYTVTVSMLLAGVPRDRVARALSNNGLATLAVETGFNRRVRQLKTLLHGNWAVIALANQKLLEMYADAEVVNGFCEPAYCYDGPSEPRFVGGEWFGADPNSRDAGLVVDLELEGARRLQPIGSYT